MKCTAKWPVPGLANISQEVDLDKFRITIKTGAEALTDIPLGVLLIRLIERIDRLEDSLKEGEK